MLVALLAACATPSVTEPRRVPVMVTVPIQLAGGSTYVSVRVNTRAEDALFLLDTGSSITILTPLFAKRLELAIPKDGRQLELIGIGGHKVRVPLVTVERLAVGAASVDNMGVVVYDAVPDARTVDGILGLDFLKRFRFTVDTPGKQLRLESTPSP